MEGDVITLTDLFIFQQTGTDQEGRPIGQFRPTGLRPMFSAKLEAMGYRLDRQMFMMREGKLPAKSRDFFSIFASYSEIIAYLVQFCHFLIGNRPAKRSCVFLSLGCILCPGDGHRTLADHPVQSNLRIRFAAMVLSDFGHQFEQRLDLWQKSCIVSGCEPGGGLSAEYLPASSPFSIGL